MFSLDVRSLALFRVGIASILLLDLFVRSWHLEEFYTNNGVLPIPAALHIQNTNSASYWSFHLISGSYIFNAMLFLIAGIFAVCLLIGWHTTLFTFLSWIMLTSLHNRFELNLNGGDLLLRVILFWCLFIPLGRSFSIDAVRKKLENSANSKEKEDNQVLSFGSVALIFQFVAMYIFSYGLKFGNTWWEGTAVSAALQQEQFLTRFGFFLRSILFPPEFFTESNIRWNLLPPESGIFILKFFTWGTLNYELYGPYLLVAPVYTEIFRIIGVTGFVLMHLSFGMCMQLGFFMYIPCVIAVSFLPPLFWHQFSNIYLRALSILPRGSKNQENIIYYQVKDIHQRNSNSFRNVIWQLFITFGAYPEGIKIIQTTNSHTLKKFNDVGQFFLFSEICGEDYCMLNSKETSLLRLILYSPVYSLLFSPWFIIPALRRRFFQFVEIFTSSRSWEEIIESRTYSNIIVKAAMAISVVTEYFIRFTLFYSFNSIVMKNSFTSWKATTIVKNIFIILMILYCLQWNINAHYDTEQVKSLLFISDYLRLDQWWGMFSPNPPLEYAWFIIPGQLIDGTIVNLMPGASNPFQAPSSEKPAIISDQYPNQRWRKYLMNLTDPENKDYLLFFGQYLCRSWNYPTGKHQGNRMLKTFEIQVMEVNPTIPDFSQPQPSPSGYVLWAHKCF